jgi:hypothetical protein
MLHILTIIKREFSQDLCADWVLTSIDSRLTCIHSLFYLSVFSALFSLVEKGLARDGNMPNLIGISAYLLYLEAPENRRIDGQNQRGERYGINE